MRGIYHKDQVIFPTAERGHIHEPEEYEYLEGERGVSDEPPCLGDQVSEVLDAISILQQSIPTVTDSRSFTIIGCSTLL